MDWFYMEEWNWKPQLKAKKSAFSKNRSFIRAFLYDIRLLLWNQCWPSEMELMARFCRNQIFLNTTYPRDVNASLQNGSIYCASLQKSHKRQQFSINSPGTKGCVLNIKVVDELATIPALQCNKKKLMTNEASKVVVLFVAVVLLSVLAWANIVKCRFFAMHTIILWEITCT